MDRSSAHAGPTRLLPAVRHPIGWIAVVACALTLLGAVAWRDGDASAAPSQSDSDSAAATVPQQPHVSSAQAPSREVAEAVPFL